MELFYPVLRFFLFCPFFATATIMNFSRPDAKRIMRLVQNEKTREQCTAPGLRQDGPVITQAREGKNEKTTLSSYWWQKS